MIVFPGSTKRRKGSDCGAEAEAEHVAKRKRQRRTEEDHYNDESDIDDEDFVDEDPGPADDWDSSDVEMIDNSEVCPIIISHK